MFRVSIYRFRPVDGGKLAFIPDFHLFRKQVRLKTKGALRHLRKRYIVKQLIIELTRLIRFKDVHFIKSASTLRVKTAQRDTLQEMVSFGL